MTVKAIQHALAERGYTFGAIDGIWGRRTQAAVRKFQFDEGLEVDGVVGPQTAAALFGAGWKGAGNALDDAALVWFQEARRLMGTKEKPGVGSNPVILDWADNLDVEYGSDDIAWCGLFVGHCIGATLGTEPLPQHPLSARGWLSFGVESKPKPGAVLVFWRVSKTGPLGHVGFYAGEDAGAYRVLGGNQSDSVSLAWVDKKRLLMGRWPSTVAHVEAETVTVARTDLLSWNEA